MSLDSLLIRACPADDLDIFAVAVPLVIFILISCSLAKATTRVETRSPYTGRPSVDTRPAHARALPMTANVTRPVHNAWPNFGSVDTKPISIPWLFDRTGLPPAC